MASKLFTVVLNALISVTSVPRVTSVAAISIVLAPAVKLEVPVTLRMPLWVMPAPVTLRLPPMVLACRSSEVVSTKVTLFNVPVELNETVET